MAWRDRLLPASFRGAPFVVETHNVTGGRRVQQHEYPGRDRPFAEDLGRRARGFDIKGWIVGENYDFFRELLIVACERPEAGLLIHPYRGIHLVVCERYEISERTDEGGMCRVTLTLIESGRRILPLSLGNLVTALADAAGGVAGAITDGFARAFEV